MSPESDELESLQVLIIGTGDGVNEPIRNLHARGFSAESNDRWGEAFGLKSLRPRGCDSPDDTTIEWGFRF